MRLWLLFFQRLNDLANIEDYCLFLICAPKYGLKP